MKKILLTLISLFAYLCVAAQDEPKVIVKDSASVSAKNQPQYSLQQCIRTALDNNLTVKRSFFNVETYKINMFTGWGAFMPILSLNASAGLNYGRNLNPVNYTYYNGVTKTINPSAIAQWTVFNGFRILRNFQSTVKNVEAADLDLEKAKNDVIINVATYYVNVILNRELYENSKVQLSSSQQQLQKIARQVEVGALPKSNELNQEAIVATNETNMITQENTLNISLLVLKQAMQVPASTPLDVIVPDINVEDMIIDQSPEEIYAVSAQTLPQVKSALLKVDAAQYALQSARGSYYPTIRLSASATSNYSSASDVRQQATTGAYQLSSQPIGQVGNDPTQLIYGYVPVYETTSDHYHAGDQLHNNLYKSLGVTVSVPILNGLTNRGNVRQALVNEELAKINVTDAENQLRQAIETAYNNALAAAKTYAAAVKQVSASEEAYRMTKVRLDNGAANFVEYQISANDLFSARSTLARAKYNFLLTKKTIDFYQGKSIEY